MNINIQKSINVINEMWEEKYPTMVSIEKYDEIESELAALESQWGSEIAILERQHEEEVEIMQQIIDEKVERIVELEEEIDELKGE